jgi:S-DNA-T family DNA segregation ATPase FtsK/SpoIIIE
MNAYWEGERPEEIPIVPEKIALPEFMEKPKTKEILSEGGIPFAVDFEYVKPMELSVMKDKNTLVMGELADSVEETFKTLINIISANTHVDVGLTDNQSVSFKKFKENTDIYADNATALEEFTEKLQSLYEAREDAFLEAQNNDSEAVLDDKIRPMVVMVTDVAHVIETVSMNTQTTFAKLIENGPRMGIYFIIGGVIGTVERLYDDITQAVKKQKSGVLLGRISDQNMLEVPNRPFREKNLLPYEAYYIQQGISEKIKIVSSS